MPPARGSALEERKSRIKEELKQRRPFASPRGEAAAALLRAGDMARRYYEALVAPYDITFHQYNVLRILRGAGSDGLPTLEIADRMIEKTPGITRLIDRLESGGLVERRQDPDDRRRVLCAVTPRGLALLKELDEPLDAWDDRLMDGFGDGELERFIEALDRIRSTLARHLSS